MNGGSEPELTNHALDQDPPRTSPPLSPTPTPHCRAPAPARGPAIRRGATERGEEWPREGVDPRRTAARERGRRQPRRPSSSPPLRS
ncbi:hypothetical protein HU200_059010 [Digitaria exilis]|uniref:Uncharacterized protein n=1 Tax=Digitaria exilis TaxID=1010633 RepID=A0A835AC52_9POAL|nr:hypothetical protein HU200_059010 [Digitaria exilis]